MPLLPVSASLLSLALTAQIAPLPIFPAEHPLWLSQKATTASDILLKLPRPKGAPSKLSSLFMANAYQQQGLNFQTKGLPAPTVDFYRQALTKLGYQERTINATQGDWGFSLVFDTPVSVNLAPKDSSKKVVLVIQGTMIGPDTINLNLRFEEI